uniref:Ring finger protein n=1 Tax=Wenzhou virus 3 TaxID=1587502 RepID=A0A0A7RC65_9VIRU|nr:ring finger protein [Wenzhou virus 3]
MLHHYLLHELPDPFPSQPPTAVPYVSCPFPPNSS